MYRFLGKPDLGLKALAKAETLVPTDPWLHLNAADLLLDAGQLEQALVRIRKVVDHDAWGNRGALLGALTNLGKTLTQVGEFAEARDAYVKLIQLEPGRAWSYGNYAAKLLHVMDDHEEAIVQARAALALKDYGHARQTLALGLLNRWSRRCLLDNDPIGAQPSFDEALKVWPNLRQANKIASRNHRLVHIQVALNKYNIDLDMQPVELSGSM